VQVGGALTRHFAVNDLNLPTEDKTMRTLTLPIAFTAALTLAGCAGMSDTGRRTTTGAGLGAATGALVGSFSANAGKGALIGAGVGALGGYLYDQDQKRHGN
jgi:uncharacterized membrane protein